MSVARLAIFALALAALQCTSNDAAKPDASAAAGGTGASGGAGGTGGNAASGGSSGTGAAAGSGGSASDWGALPTWTPIPGTVAGCSLERLANPGKVRLFKWNACSFAANCEEAEFGPAMKWLGFNPTSMVQDDGTTVRVALSFSAAVFVTGPDGVVVDGFQTHTPDCSLSSASVRSARFAVHVASQGATVFGGVLAEIGTESVETVTLTTPPPGVPGPWYPLGPERWVWGWAPNNRLSSTDLSGGDFQLFAPVPLSGPALAFLSPVSAGSIFLFQEYDTKDGGTFQGKIAWSDGIKAPESYLVPPSSNDDYGFPAYAHTRVGFLKGIGRKDVNSFDSVELWSTPFSEDPAQLAPQLVTKLPAINTSMNDTIGGFGRISMPILVAPKQIAIGSWDLKTGDSTTFQLPDDHKFKFLAGLTRTHLWIGAAKPNLGIVSYLVRLPVK